MNRRFLRNCSAASWDAIHNSSFRPTSRVQKVLLAVGGATVALQNPLRADMVNVLCETTGLASVRALYNRMNQNPVGRQILAEKPRISSTSIDMDKLQNFNDGSLGKGYWQWLTDNGVTPDTRAQVTYIADPELAYVVQRYREIHDFYHVLLEQNIDLLGETVVKAFEAVQTRFPMCVLGTFGGVPNVPRHQRRVYFTQYLPWALKVAKNSDLLLNYKFEDMLEEDLTKIRKQIGIFTFKEWKRGSRS